MIRKKITIKTVKYTKKQRSSRNVFKQATVPAKLVTVTATLVTMAAVPMRFPDIPQFQYSP